MQINKKKYYVADIATFPFEKARWERTRCPLCNALMPKTRKYLRYIECSECQGLFKIKSTNITQVKVMPFNPEHDTDPGLIRLANGQVKLVTIVPKGLFEEIVYLVDECKLFNNTNEFANHAFARVVEILIEREPE